MGRESLVSSYTTALTWDESYAGFLKEMGYPAVHHLPLAADVTLFNREPRESWDIPPTFVGNSMTDYAEREWVWIDERPELRAAMVKAFEAGRVTRANFEKGLEALLAPDLAGRLTEDEKRHAELVFFLEGSRRLRAGLLEALGPLGLEVRGDEEWKRTVPNAGGPVHYTTSLPEFYGRCEVNLNVTSIQMPTTVNQRVFDVPAAGGFLLTDAQAALGDLFDMEHEVACYSTFEECREMFQYYRANPLARRQIAAKARKRILGEHTYEHRLRQLVAVLKERFAA